MDINDVLPPEVNLQKYADDILTYIISDKALENEFPQNIVDAVNNWCVKNKMRLNTTKCKIVIVCNGSVANPPAPIHLNGDVLEYVYLYKYLGVDLNGQLNWNQQWKRVLSVGDEQYTVSPEATSTTRLQPENKNDGIQKYGAKSHHL